MAAGISLLAGVLIFRFGDAVPFIRYSLGDFVIVIFIYSTVRALFPDTRPLATAAIVFLFSLTIEVLQYAGIPSYFDTRKAWVQIIIGSRFEWLDIVMYAAGLLFILWLERKYQTMCN
jgi:hypothetical protein